MDQSRDVSGQQLYRLTQLCTPPEFVKKATVPQLCGDGQLPPEAYGDPRHRLFPCHTAAATWASLAFMLDKRAALKPVDAEVIEERIMHSGNIHGISSSLRNLKEAFARNIPSPDATLSDDDFALVYEDGGQKYRRFRMMNAGEVKAAAEYLNTYRDHPAMGFEVRRQLADKILQKQAQLGVTLGPEMNEFIEKQAGHGACTAKEAAEMIRGRVYASRRGPGPLSQLQEEMTKFAVMIDRNPSQLREPGVRAKVAALVDQFDREQGLRDYGPHFPRPEDVLFGVTHVKMAELVRDYVGLTTGSIYKLADLERLRLTEVRDYFGDDFADQLTSDGLHVDSEKAAHFLKALPLPDARELDRLMDGLGIRPTAKEAAAEPIRFSPEQLRELADYRRRVATIG